MDLWWYLRGYLSVELTGADVPRLLRLITKEGIRAERIEFLSALTVRFLIYLPDYPRIRKMIDRTGAELKITGRFGARGTVWKWKNRKILLCFLSLLILLNIFLQSRVLFIRVEGNERIPSRMILECASGCGVSFGMSRRELRSEKTKNMLLELIPELSWVGVNTQGCVGVITVQERDLVSAMKEQTPGNLVASDDGIVVRMDVTQGNPICVVGKAVRAGDVLVSGYTDLGIATRVVSPQAEIFAMTQHGVDVVIPEKSFYRSADSVCVKKYGLQLGKNRINFYQDSGILYPTCGKMTEIDYLTLPGGWELPVALVTETYQICELEVSARSMADSVHQLVTVARRYQSERMVAGKILSQKTEVLRQRGQIGLHFDFECEEMIARWSAGAYLEGDANDD